MAIKTLYPTADVVGPWQLNAPLPVPAGSALITPKGSTAAVYVAGDLNADAFFYGADYGLDVPAGAEATDTALLLTWSMDATAGTELTAGDAPRMGGTNEVQTVSSDRTGGTFTLDAGTTTTAALDAAALDTATLTTELEALPEIGAGNVQCTGGPLTADILIEFIGDLREQPIATLNVTDSGTGGTAVTVTETTPGAEGDAFTLLDSFNIPHAGGNGETEAHLWAKVLVAGDLTNHVNATTADHDGLDSWAALLMVFEDLHGSPIDVVSAVLQGNATGLDWPTFTPGTDGAYLLAVASWGKTGGGLIVNSLLADAPDGMEQIGYPQSDAITAGVWGAGPLPAVPHLPQSISWGALRDYTAVLISLAPSAALAAADVYEVIDSTEGGDYLELKAGQGSVYEVVEFDLSTLPAGAIITGVRVEFAHLAAQSSKVRVFPVAINPDDSIVETRQSVGGFIPEPLAVTQQQSTEEFTELGDGTRWPAYDRIGVAIVQTQSPIGVATHRVEWLRIVVTYDIGGPTVATVTAPAAAADPVAWTYSNAAGKPQTHYQVRLIAGAGEDPDTAAQAANPADPSAGQWFHDSGKVAAENTRSYSLANIPQIRGDVTAAVRVWALLSNGVEYVSDWVTDDYNLGGAPVAGSQTDTPAFEVTDGGVKVDADPVPAGATRAWLWRSTDSGATWSRVTGSPFTVSSPGPVELTDTTTPANVATLRYQITYDTGSGETSAPEVFPGGDVSSAVSSFYFIDPAGNIPTAQPDIRPGYRIDTPIRAVTVNQPGRSISATSPPLATTIRLSIRAHGPADRAAAEAFLFGGVVFRVVDILGREFTVRNAEGSSAEMQLWQPLPGEGTVLSDAHHIDVTLIEETYEP